MRQSFIFSVAGSRVCCSQSPFLLRSHESKRETQEMKSNSEGGGRLLYEKKSVAVVFKTFAVLLLDRFFFFSFREREHVQNFEWFSTLLWRFLRTLGSWVLNGHNSFLIPEGKRATELSGKEEEAFLPYHLIFVPPCSSLRQLRRPSHISFPLTFFFSSPLFRSKLRGLRPLAERISPAFC